MNYLFCFLLSLILSLLLTPLVRNLGARTKELYTVSTERWRKRHVSKGGGIAIFLAFFVSAIIFIPGTKVLLGVLLGAVIIFILGLVDDIKNIRPQTKLIGQLIAASLVVSLGVNIWTLNSIFGPLKYVLLIVWIVGITNAFNLLDNMDGLAAGTAFIACIFMAIYNFWGDNQSPMPVFLMLALGGASLGFLKYNFRPAKIYMGDSGSLFLGYMVSVCSIVNTPKIPANLLLILLVPSLILAVPIFDTTFVMILRGLNKISIFQGGKDHTSHRVVKLGLPEEKAVLLFYLISIFFGVLGIVTLKYSFTYVHAVIILSVMVLAMFGLFLGKMQVYRSMENGFLIKRSSFSKNGTVLKTVLMNKSIFLEVFIDFLLIFIAYVFAFGLLYDYQYSTFIDLIVKTLPVLVIIKFLTFAFTKIYRGIWQYLGLTDLIRIFKATILGSIFSFLLIQVIFGFQSVSARIFIIDWMALILLMEIVRGLEKTFSFFFKSYKPSEKKVLIFGAGDAGAMVLKEVRNNKDLKCEVLGFLDDDYSKRGRYIDGIRVLGTREDVPGIIGKLHVEEIIVAISGITEDLFTDLLEICKKSGVNCKKINKLLS